MNQIVVNARARKSLGKGPTGRLRREGRIPGVVYGRGLESMSLDLNEIEFLRILKEVSESTILKLDVEGKEFEVFIKKLNHNIINGKLVHVDFYAIERGKLLKTNVPLLISGTPKGVLDGGVLETPLREIDVECLPKDLPERIELDVSGLKNNEALHVRDIELPEGVRLVSHGELVVALVKPAKVVVEDEVEDGEEVGEVGETDGAGEDSEA